MALPPFWKVRREVGRVAERMSDRLPVTYMQDIVRQYKHDRSLSRSLRETRGSLELGDKVAVFILFQPKGIAESTYITLDHLRESGWSTLVVSNTPLLQTDREKIALKSAHVIERPNVGYDFGGYREGWRWLGRQGKKPQRLILMNDSTWFPLRKEDDSILRMEALGVDLAGHVFKNCHPETQVHDHLESHFMLFGPRALASSAIERFWSEYIMTNSRDQTIRRGEIPLSQVALASGLSVRGLLDRDVLLNLLGSLEDKELLRISARLPMISDGDRRNGKLWNSSAATGKEWRDDFLSWVLLQLTTPDGYLLSATFADVAIKLGGMGFLKKSSDIRFQYARLAVLDGVESGYLPPFEAVVMSEIEAKVHTCSMNGTLSEKRA
ncbi:rhamnan synthesis F family protein [Tabrizicola sp.]|uniref:rhamnan synthesis F family protein n=1 Tax=Tabrizicola sp. TaxID=2005166 RepID=UPI002FDD25D4